MLEIQKILKIHKCGLGDIFRESVTNIGNFEEEYLMTRNIGNRGICGLKSAAGGTGESRRSLILRCPPFATKEVTFDLFTSVQVTWRGWGGGGRVGSMGEGNVGDGQEAWQSYTDGPIGLRTYFIFSSISLKKLAKDA